MMLGNLSVDEIEKRMGIEFPIETKIFMEQTREETPARIAVGTGKWHCFDTPFHLVCGDIETARKIYESVKARSQEIKEKLEISIVSKEIQK